MSGVSLFLCRNEKQEFRMKYLLKAASRYTGIDTSDWECARADKGKPFFRQAPEAAFSISHSGTYWACAFGEHSLGLDLQEHQLRPYARLSRRFFHPDEDAWLCSRAYGAEDFFRIWTAKESWLKKTGEGLSAGLESFSVLSPLPDGAVLQNLSAPEGYSMCLCTRQQEPVTVFYIDPDE